MMIKQLLCTSVIVAGILLLNGCSNNPATSQVDYSLVASVENESGTDIINDIKDMTAAFDILNTGLPKKTAGDIQWQSLKFEDDWWSCSGSISLGGDNAELSISGIDSIQFLDADGNSVQNPLFSNAKGASLRHHVNVSINKTNGGFIEIARDWDLDGTISTEAETLTLTGSYAQKFNAENSDKSLYCNVAGTATVSDIVFEMGTSGWSGPVSGVITVTSSYKNIVITFEDGSAHIVVTGTDDSVVKDVTIPLT